MSGRDVEAMLIQIRNNPTLLHEAPDGTGGADMDRRRFEETHPCYRCGRLAEKVFVCDNPQQPGFGRRWLDLCNADYEWLIAGLNELYAAQQASHTLFYYRPEGGWQ